MPGACTVGVMADTEPTEILGTIRRWLRTFHGSMPELEHIVDLEEMAEEIHDAVRGDIYLLRLRDPSFTWAVIGEAFGITRQAAQQRFSVTETEGAEISRRTAEYREKREAERQGRLNRRRKAS